MDHRNIYRNLTRETDGHRLHRLQVVLPRLLVQVAVQHMQLLERQLLDRLMGRFRFMCSRFVPVHNCELKEAPTG